MEDSLFSEARDSSRAGEQKSSPPLIEYKNVTIMRNSRIILDNINLTIHSGEQVAILGPNGAGKSSLLKTITREYYPLADGQDRFVRIMGEEFWDVFELRKHLGIVSWEAPRSIFRDFTCFEIVLSGFLSSIGIWNYQEITPEMQYQARQIMGFLGISHLLERNFSEISAGETRLVLIARALVHDPEALLLDEPTSSLDPGATVELRRIMRKIAIQGKTLIVITHNLSDIIPEIKRVIMIAGGKIVADGRKEELLKPECLADLFGIKLEVFQRNGYYHMIT